MLFYIFSKLQFVKPTHYSIRNIGTLLTGIHSHRLDTWDPYTMQQQEQREPCNKDEIQNTFWTRSLRENRIRNPDVKHLKIIHQ